MYLIDFIQLYSLYIRTRNSISSRHYRDDIDVSISLTSNNLHIERIDFLYTRVRTNVTITNIFVTFSIFFFLFQYPIFYAANALDLSLRIVYTRAFVL